MLALICFYSILSRVFHTYMGRKKNLQQDVQRETAVAREARHRGVGARAGCGIVIPQLRHQRRQRAAIQQPLQVIGEGALSRNSLRTSLKLYSHSRQFATAPKRRQRGIIQQLLRVVGTADSQSVKHFCLSYGPRSRRPAAAP